MAHQCIRVLWLFGMPEKGRPLRRTRVLPSSSECHPGSQLQCASSTGTVHTRAAPECAGDISKRLTCDGCTRITEGRRVGEIECFSAQLQVESLRHLHVFEQ